MKKLFFISLATILVLIACKKVDDPGEAPRLFRPVIKEALESNGNWIKTSWQAVSGSASYTAEISTDSFKTVAASVKIDTNIHLFENLYWDKLYQVRVKANALDTSHSSKFGSLGAIKTARFPTILNIPALGEVNDNSVKVSWTTSGAAVTEVKILLATDSSVVKTATLTPTDVTNAYKLVSGLNGSTAYIIFLYSGTTVRGWANFSTKAPLAGSLIDLRGYTGVPNLLMDTIPDIASGSIVLLKRGETYNISAALDLNKTLTFQAGDDLLNPNRPIIYLINNFNIAAASNIDSLVFKDVILRGSDYATKYIFNIDQSCNVGKIHFEACLMEIFRGAVRIKGGTSTYGKLSMNNCVVDSVKDYGVFNVDFASSVVSNIAITNSTIYKVDKIIVSKSNAVSVLVENVTVNECPLGSTSYLIDYNTLTVTNGITINNCILGTGRNNAGVYTTRDARASASTVINANNNYRTSDRISGNATYDLPGIISYTKTAPQLWQNPSTGDFKIIDGTFPGKANTGDPRWRP